MIGTGGFSDVWKVENKKNGKIYALKVMEKARIIAKKSVDAVLLEKTLMS
jgi:serine/threonine protein kinase